jgi:hypothetical protein
LGVRSCEPGIIRRSHHDAAFKRQRQIAKWPYDYAFSTTIASQRLRQNRHANMLGDQIGSLLDSKSKSSPCLGGSCCKSSTEQVEEGTSRGCVLSCVFYLTGAKSYPFTDPHHAFLTLSHF